MSRLSEHDLHLRSNGHAEPISHWPVQVVRVHSHEGLVDRLMPAVVVIGLALIGLCSLAGIVFFLYVLVRLVGEVFGGL